MILITLLMLWRIGLFLIAWVSQIQYTFTPRFPYSDVYLVPSQLPQWVWGFANFDGVHYLGITKSGYFAQYTQAFFPLYPLLVRATGGVLNDQFFIISGLLVSFVCFVAGTMIFKKLLALDFGKEVVQKSLLILLVFPTSFYFAAIYTEALFFLLMVGAFWFARRKRWWMSGVCGALASATRITGILLLPALLWEVYSNYKNHRVKFRKILTTPLFYLVPIGLVSYMVYLQQKFGDAFYFWHAQSAFGAQRTGGSLVLPLQTLWRYAKILMTVSWSDGYFWTAVWELAAFFLAVGALLYAQKKKIRVSYLVFGWLAVLVPTLTGTLSSMPRYILAVLPLFIVLGLVKRRWVLILFAAAFAVLEILFVSYFIRGFWVA